LRVAIVGAGPAGFYAAGHLIKAGAQVDVLDLLPTPFGLVRAGVAPDHPKIKSVTRVFDKTAAEPGFRFFGNVEVGTAINPDELAAHYDAVIYSFGAATDRRMGIPGEDLPGSHPATDFVAWYNGHPDYAGHEFDLSAERVAVIGNGNVAIDVARMLVLSDKELAATDVADHALAGFRASRVREVLIIGRRGPAQAAFTNPEVLELGELDGADVHVDPSDAELDPLSRAWLDEHGDKTRRVNVQTLAAYAARPSTDAARRIRLRFLSSPVAIHGDGRVESIELERNEIVERDGRLAPRGTGETETIPVDLVFRSIGYRGVAIAGLPFDDARGVIPNEGGRVIDAEGAAVPGVYVAGWIKRGPSGVIGTNKQDAIQTAKALIEDHEAGRLPAPSGDDDALLDLLAARCPDHVTFAGWQAIDEVERAAGEPQGRPRVKLVTRDELTGAARGVAR